MALTAENLNLPINMASLEKTVTDLPSQANNVGVMVSIIFHFFYLNTSVCVLTYILGYIFSFQKFLSLAHNIDCSIREF